MKPETFFKSCWTAWIIWGTVNLALVAGFIYAVIHFVTKFW